MKTTLIYTHIIDLGAFGVRRPLDALEPDEPQAEWYDERGTMTVAALTRRLSVAQQLRRMTSDAQ